MFSVSATIDAVLAETDIAPVEGIVPLVLQRIPPEHEREALVSLLTEAIRMRIKKARIPYSSPSSVPIDRPSKWAGVRTAAGSIAKAWRVEGEGGYTFLADCDDKALAFIANAYRGREHSNRKWAERYTSLRGALANHRAAIVRDLPDAIVDRIMTGGEAIEVPTPEAEAPIPNGLARANVGSLTIVDAPVPA